jgi:hypothetical protein
VIREKDTPRDHMTTYFIPLLTQSPNSSNGRLVAKIEVFDLALVDGEDASHFRAINHQISTVSSSSATADYVLELSFPPFNQTLSYDPSLGLGTLLDSKGGKGGTGGSMLVIGVAVAIPVAVAVVVAGIAAGVAIGWWRKKKALEEGATAAAVNFDSSDNLANDQL